MIDYHFSEDKILKEVTEYIDSTYTKYYVGEDKLQSLDAIIASGHGEGFAAGNIQKLIWRYGKKYGKNREDLLKLIHYAVVMLHLAPEPFPPGVTTLATRPHIDARRGVK